MPGFSRVSRRAVARTGKAADRARRRCPTRGMGSAWPERVSQACLRATASRRYRSCDRWRHQYDSTACPISPKRSWPKVSLTRSDGRSWARLGHRAQSGLANKRPSTSGREAKLQAAQASKPGVGDRSIRADGCDSTRPTGPPSTGLKVGAGRGCLSVQRGDSGYRRRDPAGSGGRRLGRRNDKRRLEVGVCHLSWLRGPASNAG
ncbi:hypothetical protein GALL_311310 [mine drainage metagenome]|uniref:Uncharacterized protein n=1 Tax=mine drainage metagenome TaxID=410659 RepID=A0A1J5QTP3_9ZZZZ